MDPPCGYATSVHQIVYFRPVSLWDVIAIAVYLPLCFFIGGRIKNANRRNPLYGRWFMKGLAVKLLGGLAFAFVYTFYYDYGGDTRSYFHDALLVVQSLGEGPTVFWEVLKHDIVYVSSDALDYILRMKFAVPREVFVVNVTAIFALMGAGSYFSTTLLIALFTYWGVWKFFLLLVRKYPAMEEQMAFASLFIPSVFFWGSGIGKDSLILCSIGLILYHVNVVASGRFWQIKSLLIIAVSVYFTYVVKAYVLVTLVPAIVLWRTLHFRDILPRGLIRSAALPVVGFVAVVGIVFALDVLATYSPRYSVDSFVSTAQSMQGWHYREGANTSEQHGRGSSYTLGEYDDSSWRGILRVAPAALNVTYFRPYLWEVDNAAMFAQGVESLLFLVFTVYVVLKVGPVRTYRIVTNDSFLLMCVVFALFFGFAVGFSSYNFGALSRYKIPAIPFYVAALFVVYRTYVGQKRVTLARQRKGAGEGASNKLATA